MSINNLVPITGNTYSCKDKLKALGAKWNADQRVWIISADKAPEAQKIVASTPKVYTPPVFSKCRLCGCAGSQYNKIYKNGVCKGCWLSAKEELEMGH